MLDAKHNRCRHEAYRFLLCQQSVGRKRNGADGRSARPSADRIQLVSPAMAAGVTDRPWSLKDVIARIDADAPAPQPRGPYKQRGGE